jgi:hypothetical protein
LNWYKHDTDATQDAKVKKLIIRYGPIGYAIYFHCLELIAAEISEQNLTFELEHDSEIIADNLHIKGTSDKSGRDIVEEVMRYIIELELFEESSGRIFCFKLLKRLDASMTSNVKFRSMMIEAKKSHDTIMIPSCQHHDTIMQDKIRLNENTLDENIKDNSDDKSSTHTHHQRFKIPTVEEVKEYCEERKNGVDPGRFIDFYSSKGWLVGKSPMKDWRAAVRNWEPKGKPKQQSREPTKKKLLTCPVCGNIPEQEKCDTCGMILNEETLGDEELIDIVRRRYAGSGGSR